MDINKIKDGNVVGAFTYLFNKLGIIFAEVDFTEFKSVCMLRGAPLSNEYKQKIRAAQKLDDILDVLDNPLYCNWLNVRLLKRIAANIDNKSAEKLIEIYEDSVYSRQVSDVKKYFSICFNEKAISLIEVEINKDHKNLTVKQIIEYCGELEKIMDLYIGAASATGSKPGCLKITITIPIHCSLYAFKMAKKKFLQLRQIHIQYLEIESYPKVFAVNILDKEKFLLSSKNFNCKLLCYVYAYLYTNRYIRTYIATYGKDLM